VNVHRLFIDVTTKLVGFSFDKVRLEFRDDRKHFRCLSPASAITGSASYVPLPLIGESDLFEECRNGMSADEKHTRLISA
jgi:hypothetical protein